MAKTAAKTRATSKPATAKKAAAKKAVAKKTAAAKKAPAAKKAASKAAAGTTAVKKAASKAAVKSVVKSAAKKTVAKKAAAKTAARKTAAAKKTATKIPAKTARKPEPRVTKGVVATARASTSAGIDVVPPRPRKIESDVSLPADYRPTEREEYMSSQHLEYFRQKLLRWRDDLIEESQQTMENLREEVRDVGDEAERAQRETENSLELRTRDRYRKLLAQIDKALKRIEEGEYGFCEETGEPIGLERLEVRPIARFSIDAQERWELRQKHMGE